MDIPSTPLHFNPARAVPAMSSQMRSYSPPGNSSLESGLDLTTLVGIRLDGSLNSSMGTCNESVGGSPYPVLVEDSWIYPYSVTELVWGMVLIAGIFGVNIWILWVVGRSRELWKPRHLWMACLCITDLFVGAHKLLELLLLILPGTLRELCIVQKATLGIPYVVNMLLLTLLSLDRFIAVRHPFFYSASVSNKHVGIGFVLVLMTGSSLAGASITLGLRDPICRAQGLQLVYLTVVLTICSILTLFFNSSVLRIAKRQLNAIYAHDPSLTGRRLSVVCTNCGYKNETFVNTLIPIPVPVAALPGSPAPELLPDRAGPGSIGPMTTDLPITDGLILGPLDESSLGLNMDGDMESQVIHVHDVRCLMEEAPLLRAVSLPTLPDTMSVPISIVVQPDTAVVLGNVSTEIEPGTRMGSMSQLNSLPSPQMTQSLPRSRSLVSCRTHKILPPIGHKLHLFRNLHFARVHMFHVGRLFPSIRFARTVLLIMIPMWVFILPIVTIIPLHRTCEDRDGQAAEFDCSVVDMLWKYLLVHMRSVLPLQAILDTLIYACGSKEFRQALQKMTYRRTRRK